MFVQANINFTRVRVGFVGVGCFSHDISVLVLGTAQLDCVFQMLFCCAGGFVDSPLL